MTAINANRSPYSAKSWPSSSCHSLRRVFIVLFSNVRRSAALDASKFCGRSSCDQGVRR
jgi:hypothetical protein